MKVSKVENLRKKQGFPVGMCTFLDVRYAPFPCLDCSLCSFPTCLGALGVGLPPRHREGAAVRTNRLRSCASSHGSWGVWGRNQSRDPYEFMRYVHAT